MIGFAQIAGGAPSSTGALTDHLLNSTVGQEQARLAAYYSRGAVKDRNRCERSTWRSVARAVRLAMA